MKKWLIVAMFSCNIAQADMLDALKAYENKDYTQAKQQFEALLPFGNELAAFNLGAMFYQGEGQAADPVQALAYFMLAADLKHAQANDLLQKLTKGTTEAQLEQAYAIFEQLKRDVVIGAIELDTPRQANAAQPIRRVQPDYPSEAAKKGLFGYTKLRFLVDEQGQVAVVDSIDSYPKNVFERASIQAVKRWRYQATGEKHLMTVNMEYSLSGGVKVSAVEQGVAEHNLLTYALAGSPQHQLALGMLLSLIEIQSGNRFWYNPELPLTANLDFSLYKKYTNLTPDFAGFWGTATVRVAEDGTILELLKGKFEEKNTVPNLVGLKLNGKIENDVYRLFRQSDLKQKKVVAEPSIEAPRSMSGLYWWEQSAKNGNRDAQRIMAAYDPQWEHYLLNQQDAEVLAWAGTRLILEGQRERGLQFLEQAIARKYEPATEMKNQFM